MVNKEEFTWRFFLLGIYLGSALKILIEAWTIIWQLEITLRHALFFKNKSHCTRLEVVNHSIRGTNMHTHLDMVTKDEIDSKVKADKILGDFLGQ